MTREEVLNLIEDNSNHVGGKMKAFVPTQNGIMDAGALRELKKRMLSYNTTHLLDEVVKHKQEYPIKNGMTRKEGSEVDLEVDLIVMKRDDFKQITKFLEDLWEVSQK